MEHLKDLLEYKIINLEKFQLSVYQIALAAMILLSTKLLVGLIKKLLAQNWKIKKLDKGGQYAVFQFIKYFLWVAAIVFVLETIGVKITFLLAGSAALLVGLGLGLQQTFNDIIAGVILLVEGSIRVEDVIEVDGEVVRVMSIGLRTSEVVDRSDIIIILPNSKIVNDKVINWSHNIEETRFKIKVGVAYGSDVDLVIRLLQESASEHPRCLTQNNQPIARFTDFGDSALLFELLFWSDDLFRIEQVQSDIRKSINHKFIEHKIQIPFPQRDLHLKTSDISLSK